MHEAIALKLWKLVLGAGGLVIAITTLGWRVYQHLERRLEALRTEVARQDAPREAEMRTRLDKLEGDIGSLRANLATVSDLDRHFGHLNAALAELRQDVRQTNHRIDELQGRAPRGSTA